MNIKVTIFTPTYKRFDTLYKTIQSVLEQDYSNIEYIISDDGSPDFPYDDIVKYIECNKPENIKSYQVLTNEENVGTVKHLNKILKRATGDLFIPLAGDDFFFNKRVVSQIVTRYSLDNFKVLATSRVKINSEGKIIGHMPHFKSRDIIATSMTTAYQQHKLFTECKSMDFASGSAMVYDAKFLREMDYFDEKYRLWEDGPFINKITSKGVSITFAYDIVAIKYSDGGVSSGGNPIIRKDVELFNESDRWINSNNYGWYHKRILRYTQLKFKKAGIFKRLLYKFFYFDIVIDQLLYQYREYMSGKHDIKYYI